MSTLYRLGELSGRNETQGSVPRIDVRVGMRQRADLENLIDC